MEFSDPCYVLDTVQRRVQELTVFIQLMYFCVEMGTEAFCYYSCLKVILNGRIVLNKVPEEEAYLLSFFHVVLLRHDYVAFENVAVH